MYSDELGHLSAVEGDKEVSTCSMGVAYVDSMWPDLSEPDSVLIVGIEDPPTLIGLDGASSAV